MVRRFKDPRIRYYHNGGKHRELEQHQESRRLARGKYLIVLLDDDLLKPRALELMAAAFGETSDASAW